MRLSLHLLLSFLAVLMLTSTGSATGNAKKRPNILLIYTDDHSHRTVSCYSEAYKWIKTPNIDKLATKGVRFRYAYIGTWCMPSRATILTGHHPYGVKSMRMEGEYPGSTYDPKMCPFWPSILRQLGYFTAMIGKWHTGVDSGYGRDWDFQMVWNRPKYPANAPNYYKNQLVEINGAEPKVMKGYSTDNYTKWAIDVINGKQRDKSKPWFLWVNYGAVHGPFTPAKRHLETYPNIKVPTPADIYPPRAGKPAYMQKVNNWVKGKDGQPEMRGGGFTALTVDTKGIHGNTLTDWVRQYHQGVLAIDEGVGQIIAALRESGQLENTLVIFTSDQGFAWGQHGFRTKLAPYNANIRSPLIFSMPGTIPEGKVCETPVGGVDIAPTIFSFAGHKLPWKMHGHDLKPLLMNPEAKWEHPVLLTLTGRKFGADTDRVPTDPKVRDINGIPWWVFLVKGRHKYIRTLVKGEIEEIYDMKADPDEQVNLAMKKEYAGMLRQFREDMLAELRRTDAGMVDHLPPTAAMMKK